MERSCGTNEHTGWPGRPLPSCARHLARARPRRPPPPEEINHTYTSSPQHCSCGPRPPACRSPVAGTGRCRRSQEQSLAPALLTGGRDSGHVIQRPCRPFLVLLAAAARICPIWSAKSGSSRTPWLNKTSAKEALLAAAMSFKLRTRKVAMRSCCCTICCRISLCKRALLTRFMRFCDALL